MLDGSTDKEDLEELILYERYKKNNGVREVFLLVLPLDNAAAVYYLDAVEKESGKHALANWLSSSQLIGSASMTGA
jgi:hypothetical protein